MKEGDIYKYFIYGKWKHSESKKTVPVKNPYNNKVIGNVQACTKEEVDEIIQCARENIDCWVETPLKERAKVLRKAAELIEKWAEPLGKILLTENGKPIKSAISEIARTADIFNATADSVSVLAGETIVGDAFEGYTREKISMTYRVPLGVVLCIGPFNYPFNLTGSKIAPALLAGNTVVVKPPSQGAITPLHFGIILEKAGVPPGVFNIITGRGSEIGDYLTSHDGINMVSFTGSSETGKQIAQVAGLKPLLLELGGKDAAIVLDDADLEKTSQAIVSGAFSYSGQRCTAVKRVLPMSNIADQLVEMVTLETLSLSIGDPAENNTIGPLIDSKQCDYVQGLIDDALEKGATLKCGNKREGNIMWPTILDNVTEEMRIAWEEPFGPVLPFLRINSAEEGIRISNESKYGLQGMIFTENIDLAFNIAQELEVGTVQINGKSSRGPDHFPFLGAKSSGLGTQGIKYAIEAMSRPKVIVMNLSEEGKLVKECVVPNS
ncbi:MAG: aldehyde dehydrogenase family protein [Candidatus Lokiarchaeota archaeon]|nr:aldehyde dehydrogenase family protein [Candidatus Lokiarchaeota archaeon]MBD3341309.1 aldehyde dehydrogenase family protein [Candidatus Lokiarchaeota archaeon]